MSLSVEILSADRSTQLAADVGRQVESAQRTRRILDIDTLRVRLAWETANAAAAGPGAVLRLSSGDMEYRVVARTRDSAGTVTLQCESAPAELRRRQSRRRNTDGTVDSTWSVIGRTIASTLSAILDEAPSEYAAGTVETELVADHPEVTLEFAGVSIQEAIGQLAAAIGAEWKWRVTKAPSGARTYSLDLEREIGVLGTRLIGDATSLGLTHERHGREYVSRILASAGEGEEEANLADAIWEASSYECVTHEGASRYKLIMDGGVVPYDGALDGYWLQTAAGGDTERIFASEYPNIVYLSDCTASDVLSEPVVVMRGVSATDVVRLDALPVKGADESASGIVEERRTIDGSPQANLLREEGVSDDMSGTLAGSPTLPPGWNAVGAPTATRVTDPSATITGTDVLRIVADAGEGVETDLVEVTAPYASAWIAALIESGEITLELLDAAGRLYPEGRPFAGADADLAGLGASAAPGSAGQMRLRVTAVQNATIFKLDAATLTGSADPVEWRAIMGPRELWQAAGEIAADPETGPVWDEVSGRTLDLGQLSGVSTYDELEPGALLEVKGWKHGGSYRVDLSTRVVEIHDDLARDRVQPVVRLDRRRAGLAEWETPTPKRQRAPLKSPRPVESVHPRLLVDRTDGATSVSFAVKAVDWRARQLRGYVLEKSVDGADWAEVQTDSGAGAAPAAATVTVAYPSASARRTELRLRVEAAASGLYSSVYTYEIRALEVRAADISGRLVASQMMRALQTIASNIEFYPAPAAAHKTIGWRAQDGASAITLRYASGSPSQYTIAAGTKDLSTYDDTGGSPRHVFIYFDPDVSTTTLQFTTSPADVVNLSGESARVVLGVAKRAATTNGFLFYVPYNSAGGLGIITATVIHVVDLQSVSAATGSLDVDGKITIGAAGRITNSANDFAVTSKGYFLSIPTTSYGATDQPSFSTARSFGFGEVISARLEDYVNINFGSDASGTDPVYTAGSASSYTVRLPHIGAIRRQFYDSATSKWNVYYDLCLVPGVYSGGSTSRGQGAVCAEGTLEVKKDLEVFGVATIGQNKASGAAYIQFLSNSSSDNYKTKKLRRSGSSLYWGTDKLNDQHVNYYFSARSGTASHSMSRGDILTIDIGDGLSRTDYAYPNDGGFGFKIDVSPEAPIVISSGKVGLDYGPGLRYYSAYGLSVEPGDGLVIDGNAVVVDYGNGLDYDSTNGLVVDPTEFLSAGTGISLSTSSGVTTLSVDYGNGLDYDSTNGLVVDPTEFLSAGTGISLSTSSGVTTLSVDYGNGLDYDSTNGLVVDPTEFLSAGTGISLSTSSGVTTLSVDYGNGLDYDSTNGLVVDPTEFLASGTGISLSTTAGVTTITNSGSGTGDITAVTAGTGLSGGGTTGAVTLSHATQTYTGVKGTTGNNAIQTITISTLGHVTAVSTSPKMSSWTGTVAATNVTIPHAGQYDIRNNGTGITVTAATGTNWIAATIATSASDRRLKTDFRPLADPLATLRAVRPLGFAWSRQHGGFAAGSRSYGVVAQDLRGVLPDIVRCGAEGYYHVHYPALTTWCIAAIQELDAARRAPVLSDMRAAYAIPAAGVLDTLSEAPVRRYRAPNGDWRLDIAADDILDLDPTLVGDTGGRLAYERGRLIPHLVLALREARERILALESSITP